MGVCEFCFGICVLQGVEHMVVLVVNFFFFFFCCVAGLRYLVHNVEAINDLC